jgi:hypothetical protein
VQRSAEEQLAGFLAKYSPDIASFASALREKLHARLPGAVELVYDNYNGLVIGYGATERPSEAILSIAVFPRHVSLCFLRGAELPDPEGLLRGTGNIVRNLRLEGDDALDRPGVAALIAEATAHSPVPFDRDTPSRLVIRSISAKQRPRRRA